MALKLVLVGAAIYFLARAIEAFFEWWYA